MSRTAEAGTVDTDALTGLHYVGLLLAVVSGLVHLRLGVGFAPSPLGLSFLFAGVVFLAAAVGVLVDYHRERLYQLGIPFVIGQVVLWYYINFAAGDKAFPADVGTLGAVDKLAQVALVAVLALLLGRE